MFSKDQRSNLKTNRKGSVEIQECEINDRSNALRYMNQIIKTSNKNNKYDFYRLKKKILTYMIKKGYAYKIGIHIRNDGLVSEFFTLIYFGGNYFHLPSTKAERKHLPVLGEYSIHKRKQSDLIKVHNHKYLVNSMLDSM